MTAYPHYAERDPDAPAPQAQADVEPAALEGAPETISFDRQAVDQHQDRRGAERGKAARLIFEQGLAGEREQCAQAARFILLIRTDQRAKRHMPRPGFVWLRPRAFVIGQARAQFPPRPTLNRFAPPTKMVNLSL